MGPLSREDATCPICISIMLEPATLPCQHSFCIKCIRTHVQKTSLLCPVCRKRLSTWYRKATKEKSLINTEFWERIKHDYPTDVQARLAGKDSPIRDTSIKIDCNLVGPGEIRKEFDAMLTQFDLRNKTDRLEELEATNQYLHHLQETEGPPVETQLESDLQLAKRLHEEELESRRQHCKEVGEKESGFISNSKFGQPSSFKRSSVSSFFQSDAKRSRLTSVEPSTSKNSHITPNDHGTATASGGGSRTPDSNSIDNEFNQHFRPIACAPRTPPKRNPDGSFQQPVVVKAMATKRSLMNEFDASDQDGNLEEQSEADFDQEFTIHEENAASPKIAIFGKYISKKQKVETVINEVSTSSGVFGEIESNRNGTTSSDPFCLSSIPAQSDCSSLISLDIDKNESYNSILNRAIFEDSDSDVSNCMRDSEETSSDILNSNEILRSHSNSDGINSTPFFTALESLARDSEQNKVWITSTDSKQIEHEERFDPDKQRESSSEDDRCYSLTELIERRHKRIVPAIVPTVYSGSGSARVGTLDPEENRGFLSNLDFQPQSTIEEILHLEQNPTDSCHSTPTPDEERTLHPRPRISSPDIFKWSRQSPPATGPSNSVSLARKHRKTFTCSSANADTERRTLRKVLAFIESDDTNSEKCPSPNTETSEDGGLVAHCDVLNGSSELNHLDQISDEILITEEMPESYLPTENNTLVECECGKSSSPNAVSFEICEMVESDNLRISADYQNIISEELVESNNIFTGDRFFGSDPHLDIVDAVDSSHLRSALPELQVTAVPKECDVVDDNSFVSMAQELIPEEIQMEEVAVRKDFSGSGLPSDIVDEMPGASSEISDPSPNWKCSDQLSCPDPVTSPLKLVPIDTSITAERYNVESDGGQVLSVENADLNSSSLESELLQTSKSSCVCVSINELQDNVSPKSSSTYSPRRTPAKMILSSADQENGTSYQICNTTDIKKRIDNLDNRIEIETDQYCDAVAIASNVGRKSHEQSTPTSATQKTNSVASDEFKRQQEENDRKLAVQIQKRLNLRNCVESDYRTRRKSGKLNQEVRLQRLNENNLEIIKTGRRGRPKKITKSTITSPKTKSKLLLRKSDENNWAVVEASEIKTTDKRVSSNKLKITEPASKPTLHSHSTRSKDGVVGRKHTALFDLARATTLTVDIRKLCSPVVSMYSEKTKVTRLTQLNTGSESRLRITNSRNIQPQSTSPIHSSNSTASSVMPRKSPRRIYSGSGRVMCESKSNAIAQSVTTKLPSEQSGAVNVKKSLRNKSLQINVPRNTVRKSQR